MPRVLGSLLSDGNLTGFALPFARSAMVGNEVRPNSDFANSRSVSARMRATYISVNVDATSSYDASIAWEVNSKALAIRATYLWSVVRYGRQYAKYK